MRINHLKRLMLTVAICIGLLGSFAYAGGFPAKDLTGIIMWGAGGATDNVARSITPFVEPYLGKTIILQNKPGATGAISAQWVYNQKADGYTLLYGAENPQLYRLLGISKLDYKDFEPINVLARSVAVIVANNDTPWHNLKELIEDAKKHPGKINMGSTGPGGLPYVVGALLKTINGVTFNPIPFGGEGPAIMAMEGGHVAFSSVGVTAAREHLRAKRLKALAVVSDKPVPGLEGVPTITSIYPKYKKYLPWGPFYGIWVKRGIPEKARKKLVSAFSKGFNNPKFKKFLKDFGAIPMGLTGKEADKFLKHWQSVSCWMIYEAGGSKTSPDKLGIPKP